ncbi:MAG: hypothetical protein AVDCRST_MAG79-920 [uncultured Thermoleophilia bacterium]|uniref:Uncharacterized protein n=1 Tax=uncultured Thermoleophilia bacterium TaxID=1497501 RepID=A0A6J4TU09_9ACTN|nr:MAG: hypothetical protein AVDCRST_MAG79-920 [uncultured Thermoleophilia bacterium]
MADDERDAPLTDPPEGDEPSAADDEDMGVLSKWDLQNAGEFADDPTSDS